MTENSVFVPLRHTKCMNRVKFESVGESTTIFFQKVF